MAIDEVRFETQLERALDHPEIKPHIGTTISSGTLLRRARAVREEIWEAAGHALKAEDAARAEVSKLQAAMTPELRSRINERLRHLGLSRDILARLIRGPVAKVRFNERQLKAAELIRSELPKPAPTADPWFVNTGLVLGVAGAVLSAITLFVTWIVFLFREGWMNGGVAFQSTGWVQITESVLVISVILFFTSISLLGRSESRAESRALPYAKHALDDIASLIDDAEGGISSARQQVLAARSAADEALYQSIVRLLRREVDAAADDDYSTTLPNVIPSGLAEGFNVRSELITPARTRLEHLLKSMPNGSIGIAGSRGAGKSTLLRSFAAKEIIKRTTDSGDEEQLPLFSIDVSAPVQYDAREFVLYLFSTLCVRVRKMTGDTEDARNASTDRPDTPVRWEQLLIELSGTFIRICSIVGILLLVLTVISAVSLTAAPNGSKSPFEKMGVKPVEVALQSLVWFLAALVLFVGRRYAERTRSQRIDRELQERHGRDDEQQSVPPSSFPGSPDAWNTLRRKARENTILLRYQRNYASDWSVGAKFAGLEAGVKQGETWAEQKLTLPEIVALYREFVELLARDFVVLIAIDELDKIASDEKAQQFLNDIKALFGIPNCFYLITVSDNAMSTFARRGLPIRDAFDSALDEIVRVEHMDLDTAQKLLAGRVIGLPIPFLAFCYCFSAGLPRDLIRSCRDVFEHAERSGSRDLPVISRNIFREDLKAKIEGSITAITQAAQKTSGADASGILDRLWRLLSDASTKDDFLEDYGELVGLIEKVDANPTARDLRALSVDMASYLYYAMTVLEVITKHKDQRPLWDGARKAKLFEELARLRRYIGVDSLAAGRAIHALRASQQLQLASPRGQATR